MDRKLPLLAAALSVEESHSVKHSAVQELSAFTVAPRRPPLTAPRRPTPSLEPSIPRVQQRSPLRKCTGDESETCTVPASSQH